MKIFTFAAVLTGLVLVSLAVKRRKAEQPVLTDPDRRYSIDDLISEAE